MPAAEHSEVNDARSYYDGLFSEQGQEVPHIELDSDAAWAICRGVQRMGSTTGS